MVNPCVSWKNPTLILNRPYPAIFSKTPASNTLTAVGASVWASGSQLWSGHSGNLTAKAIRKKAKNMAAGAIRAVPAIRSGMPSIIWPASAGMATIWKVPVDK